MKWPEVDGEPVVIGERMKSCGIEDCKVVGIDPANSRIIFGSDEIEEGKATYFPSFAKYCHRPAPKVLDADGVEIRVGDTVWCPEGWYRYVVTKVTTGSDGKELVHARYYDPDILTCDLEPTTYYLRPYQLTHRAPVLAADGRPLREGETVYLTDSPTAFVVDDIMTREDGATVVHIKDGAWNLPQYITHEQPDSFTLIEQDAELCPHEYAKKYGKPDGISSAKFQRTDLVRRAKALAERDR